MRRAGCFGFVALMFFLAIFIVLVSVVASVAGASWLTVATALVVLVVFLGIVRAVVRGVGVAAAPMGDLIEASGRVEAGELDVQVPERGLREMRALTRAFNAMSSRLSATERARRRLFAEVSHELRTPLTVIQGNVEAMLDGIYPADREHLERIRAETRQLERLIDDLRTLSLAETGQLPLQREPTDLGALAREVAAGFQAEASAAGVVLEVDAADGLPDAEVDARRLHQVVSNLIANALRHTPSGGRVLVGLTHVRDQLWLEVRDTGSGMAPEAVAHAFERFWKSGESAGAGLGLAIVKDLVEAHGGAVSLESHEGSGTTVRVSLPS